MVHRATPEHNTAMLVYHAERTRALVLSSACGAVLLWGGIALPSLTSRARQQQNNTPMSFSGEITDAVCAAQRSHDAMIKQHGYKNAKECTLGCVKDGAKFVLFTPANNNVYQLDDQEKPATYAGQKVTVIGTYDGETKTIHIQSIEAAP